jgi:hypothetical protein
MWCPKCEKETVCAVIPLFPLSSQKDRRRRTAAPPEIPHFKRLRKCNACGEEFETVELQRSFLYELNRLRDTMTAIRDKAEVMLRWQE